MRLIRILLALLMAVALAWSGPLVAAEIDQGTSAQKEDKPAQEKVLEGLTVTATKTATPAELLPVTARSVDRADIEAQPDHYMNNVGELIRDLPGVHVAQYYPWGPPWIHLRGTGYFIGRTIYLVDGLPVTPFALTTVNPHDVERMDALLGPSSALYGANASGGAVNVITRQGKKGQGAEAEFGYGTHETFRPHLSVGNQAGEWNYYLSYSGDYSAGYKMKPVEDMLTLYRRGKTSYLKEASLEDNRYENTSAAGRVGWKNDLGYEFTAALNYANRYLYGGQQNLILDDHGHQILSSVRLKAPVSSSLKLTATAGYQLYDHPQKYNKGLSLQNGQVVLNPAKDYAVAWTNTRFPAELQADLHLAASNVLTVGGYFSRETDKRATDDWVTGANRAKTEYSTDQAAAYLQDQAFFFEDRLSLLAGLRYDHWRYFDVFDSASTPQRPDEITKDNVSLRGAAKYRFNDHFALRSSAGTAYWPGTGTWFFQNTKTGNTWREANPDLKPEKTWMVDLGLETDLPQTGTAFDLTGYYGRITDMVSYRYDQHPTLPGVTITRTQNVGQGEIYGLEFQLKQKLVLEGLWLIGSLTLNHSKILNSPTNTGHQMRNCPDYFGSVILRYLNPRLANAQVALRFSDDRFYDDENTNLPFFKMKAYQTVDFKVWRDWPLTKDWILTTSLSGTNVFDVDYETEIVYKAPGYALEATVGVKYKF